MQEVNGNTFGKVICKALGIDAGIVRAVEVNAKAWQQTSIEVTVSPVLSDEQLCEIGDALIAEGHTVQIILKRGA